MSLQQLRHRLNDVARLREKLVERVGLFPNEANQRQLDALASEQAELESLIALKQASQP